MPNIVCKYLILPALLLVAACSDRGQVHIEHAWMQLPQTESETAGFLAVRNPGGEPVEIVSADSEAFEAVNFYRQREGRLVLMESLTVPARGHLDLDGDNGRLGFTGPRRDISDGDRLSLALAVRLPDGQLITLESELHVHEDAGDAEHGHEDH